MKKELINRFSLFISLISLIVALVQGWSSIWSFILRINWLIGSMISSFFILYMAFLILCFFAYLFARVINILWTALAGKENGKLMPDDFFNVDNYEDNWMASDWVMGSFLFVGSIVGTILAIKINPLKINFFSCFSSTGIENINYNCFVRGMGWIIMISLFILCIINLFPNDNGSN